MNNKTTWQNLTFSELSTVQLYDLLKLRVDVFVVEQTCYYADLDSLDGCLDRHNETQHLLGYQNDKLIAYLRILAKGQSYENYISIGRVAIAKEARGFGLGHEMIVEALRLCQQNFPRQDIKISAQQHLESYYGSHGFIKASDMYLEDDIPHIAMLKLQKNILK
jgi:ElaA protein